MNKIDKQIKLTKNKFVIGWVGSKRTMLDRLRKHMPDSYNNYYEPFVGGGSVFFNIGFKNATLSDSGINLINTYQVIKDSLSEFLTKLKVHWDNHSKVYYKNFPHYDMRTIKQDKVQQAADWFYLVWFGYGHFAELNSNGFLKISTREGVNFSQKTFDNVTKRLTQVSEYLNQTNTTLKCASWEQVIDQAQAGDFVYLDPPYDAISNHYSNRFNQWTSVKLATKLKELHNKGVKWMLSNTNSPLVELLYKDFYIYTYELTNSLSSLNHALSTKRTEVIITNYVPMEENAEQLH